ncbi:MAG: MBL fold metallo-hydrolase [Clostridia bacterium]|nr:MBL fold metallo-hydrolase [Clostridia bacterium]
MEVKTLFPVGFYSNCYFFENDEFAFIVDPGEFSGKLKSLIDLRPNKKFVILLTHGHFDHILGVAKIKEYVPCTVVISKEDALMLSDADLSLNNAFENSEMQIPVTPDITVTDGEQLDFGGTKIDVMITPGHTNGSTIYLVDDIMFSGDTLFCMSIGRTDFPNGSDQKMRESLKRLKNIQKDYRLLSGHGEASTLNNEKKNNYFLVCI